MIAEVEPLGNVFRGIPGESPAAPVWSFEDPTPRDPKARTGMFTCPVSAIPGEVWDLLRLWNECRLVGMAPVPGGWLDQPAGVRRSFPLFSAEYQTILRRQGQGGAERTAMMVAGAMLQGLFGKG